MTGCMHFETEVTDSRPTMFNKLPTVRRRRKCKDCGKKWFSVEVEESLADTMLAITKSANRYQRESK